MEVAFTKDSSYIQKWNKSTERYKLIEAVKTYEAISVNTNLNFS